MFAWLFHHTVTPSAGFPNRYASGSYFSAGTLTIETRTRYVDGQHSRRVSEAAELSENAKPCH